jgi:hypothetical protein
VEEATEQCEAAQRECEQLRIKLRGGGAGGIGSDKSRAGRVAGSARASYMPKSGADDDGNGSDGKS